MDNEAAIEPFHAALAFDSDDVICEGSDSEQTEAEVRSKRARYEEQASRILQGHVPMILSATLKGPFDQEHGWNNPWKVRRQPKSHANTRVAKLFQSHSRPRSGKDLNTLESTTRDKSSDVEVQVKSHENQDVSTRPLSTASTSYIPGPMEREGSRRRSIDSVNNGQGRSRRQSMDKDTIQMTDIRREDSRAWLKGSHVSRTARWDQKDVPSPTPSGMNPRRRSGSKMTVRSASMRSAAPRAKVVLLDHDNMPGQFGKRKLPDQIRGYEASEAQSVGHDRFGSDMNDESAQNLLNNQLRNDLEQDYDAQFAMTLDSPQLWQYTAPATEESLSMGSHVRTQDAADMAVTASFVTEVAPSCRDLEKFQFRKRRRLDTAPQSAAPSPSLINRIDTSAAKHNNNEKEVEIVLQDSPSNGVGHEASTSEYDSDDGNEDWETTFGERAESSTSRENRSSPQVVHSPETSVGAVPEVDLILDDDGDNQWDTTIGQDSFVRSVGSSSIRKSVRQSPTPRQRTPGMAAASWINFDVRSAVAQSSPIEYQSTMTSKPYGTPYSAPAATEPRHVGHDEPASSKSIARSAFMVRNAKGSFLDENDISTQSANTTPSRTIDALRLQKGCASVQSTKKSSRLGQNIALKGESPCRSEKLSSQHEVGLSQERHTRSIRHEQTKNRIGFSPLRLNFGSESSSNMLPQVTNSPFDVFKLFQTSLGKSPALQSPKRAHSEVLTTVLPTILSSPVPVLKRRRRTKSANSQPAPPEITLACDFLEQFVASPSTPSGVDIEIGPDLTNSSSRKLSLNIEKRQDEPPLTEVKAAPSVLATVQEALPLSPLPKPYLAKDSLEVDHDLDDIAEQLATGIPRPTPEPMLSVTPGHDQDNSNEPTKEPPGSPEATTQSPWHQEMLSTGTRTPIVNLQEQHGKDVTATVLLKVEVVEPEPKQSQWQPFEPVALHTSRRPSTPFASALRSTSSPIPDGGIAGLHEDEVQEQSQWQAFQPIAISASYEANTPANVSRALGSPALDESTARATVTPMTKFTSQNPWASTRRNSTTKKSKKRVSFGVAADDQPTNSPQTPQDLIALNQQQASSPEIDHNESQGLYAAKRTITLPEGTRDCFTVKKSFKRILPDKSASQINSSPAPIDAMAEAFVAADVGRKTSEEHIETPRGRSHSSMSPFESIGKFGRNAITPMSNISEEQEDVDYDADVQGFNIDEYLDEATDFLGDWSVEAEVKKSREQEKAQEKTPLRSSRLFGMF